MDKFPVQVADRTAISTYIKGMKGQKQGESRKRILEKNSVLSGGLSRDVLDSYQPSRHEISQARDIPLETLRKMERTREAQELRQRNLNRAYLLDPLASRVNGLYNHGTANNPQVSKIGPSPLEAVAQLTVPGQLISTGAQVAKTVSDPSGENLIKSGLGLLGPLRSGAAVLPNTSRVGSSISQSQALRRLDQIQTGASLLEQNATGSVSAFPR